MKIISKNRDLGQPKKYRFLDIFISRYLYTLIKKLYTHKNLYLKIFS